MDTVILTNGLANGKINEIKVLVNSKDGQPRLEEAHQLKLEDGIPALKHETLDMQAQSAESVKTESSQTPLDIRGQGDSKSVVFIRPFRDSSDKTMVQGQPGLTTTALTPRYTTLSLPYHTLKGIDMLEQMKRRVAQGFVKQSLTAQVPKSSLVPGTNVEYRTPGAHYKNKNGKIKRPMNAFMVWARDVRGRLATSMTNATNSEISVRLGQIWAAMSPEEKKKYYDIAERIKVKHRKDYPDWVYQPSASQQKRKDDQVMSTNTKTPSPPKHVMASSKPPNITVINLPAGVNTKTNLLQAASISDNSNDSCVQKKDDFTSGGQQTIRTSQSLPGLNTTQNNNGQLYLAKVPYHSAFEIPGLNTVSSITKDLLATKLSACRQQNVISGTNLHNHLQNGGDLQRPVIGTTIYKSAINQPQKLITNQNVSSCDRSSQPRLVTSTVRLSAPNQPPPRIMGIVSPRLQIPTPPMVHISTPPMVQISTPSMVQISTPPMENIKLHGVRPFLAKHLHQGSSQCSPKDITTHASGYRGPLGIPVVEALISPITPRLRQTIPTSKLVQNSSQEPVFNTRKETTGPENQRISFTTGSASNGNKNLTEMPKKGPVQLSNTSQSELTSNHGSSEISHPSVVNEPETDDKLWPFPFSENPDDWPEKPQSHYMELFDLYDPFLTEETLLSEKYPGSLHLDMDRWKQYLEEDIDDNAKDPFKSFRQNAADDSVDIIPSPLPLKQTLTRLLNAHVQTSDTGDIIIGDLVTEGTLIDELNFKDEFKNANLLTNEMAVELSSILNETCPVTADKNCIVEIIDTVLDEVMQQSKEGLTQTTTRSNEVEHTAGVKCSEIHGVDVDKNKTVNSDSELTEKINTNDFNSSPQIPVANQERIQCDQKKKYQNQDVNNNSVESEVNSDQQLPLENGCAGPEARSVRTGKDQNKMLKRTPAKGKKDKTVRTPRATRSSSRFHHVS